ncbi:MAG: hypothetical protein AAF823_00310 [Planctomycetota bacterium]
MDSPPPPGVSAPTPPPQGLTPSQIGQLNTLGVLNYVFAALAMVTTLCPAFYIVLGTLIATGVVPESSMDSEPDDPPVVFVMFFCGMFAVFPIGLAILGVLAGRGLQNRRGYVLCMVNAGVQCLCIPLGTVLGIFTLVILSNPQVKDAFDQD